MNEAIQNLLEYAGVLSDNNGQDSAAQTSYSSSQLYALLESWLGISNNDNGNSGKDGSHMNIETTYSLYEDGNDAWDPVVLFHHIHHLLVQGWTPPYYGTEGGLLMHSNALIEQSHLYTPETIHLRHVFEAVQVTEWVRTWIDLSLQSTAATNVSSLSFIEALLQHDASHAVLHALYAHVEAMPYLQAQIYQYAQSLKQSTAPSASTTLLTDPASRLQQYQRAQTVTTRLEAEWQAHTDRVQTIVSAIYQAADPPTRTVCRHHLGRLWSLFLSHANTASSGLRQENTKAAYLSLTLHLLYRILLGISNELTPAHVHLLTYHLIPLHQPDSLVLWRDQMSILELYHASLVQCIAVLLQKQPSLLPRTIAALLQPEIFTLAGNTPKQVLLLHEMDTYVGLMDPSTYLDDNDVTWLHSLWHVVARCMASEHSRVAERALSYFQNSRVMLLVKQYPRICMAAVIPALARRSEPPWNPTVRKMTYHVLNKLHDLDTALFAAVCESMGQATMAPPKPESHKSTSHILPESSAPPVVTDHSLKAGMGSWRPPPRRGGGAMPPPRGGGPPLTVTGVAPWASSAKGGPPGKGSAPWVHMSSAPHPPSSGNTPPLTITGVAPWATSTPKPPLQGQQPPLTVTGVAPWAAQSTGSGGTHKLPAPPSVPRAIQEGSPPSDTTDNVGTDNEPTTALARVLAYMNKLKPPEELEGASAWSKAQMAETPTLLPDLRFHDLVFGHDLGTGSFGVVRYARLIDRNQTRSSWPEYAVKIISTEKIYELEYEASVQREIAVLRILSHPGIARLVSNFRFREAAYLVLEYASGGDLHTLLRKHGSLDHDSARFVLGEVIAALASIHEAGLVYADLKPENIVLTESGHVKLTDFGGCRPVTPEAKAQIHTIARDLLKNLRDGDWKPSTHHSHANKMDSEKKGSDEGLSKDKDAEEENMEEDYRVEGTTAYLPPEVVMGAYPTFAADAWALGCVLYQCLTGRPPILEVDDEATRHRIVNFDVQDSGNEVDRLFQDKHATGVSTDARDLIRRLLNRDASQRIDMQQAAQHDFFAGTNVFELHRTTAYPLDIGSVEPAPDAQWSRRQFSSIWAPQPVSYNVALPSEDDAATGSSNAQGGRVPEGAEATSYFTVSKTLPQQHQMITEKMPLPRSGTATTTTAT
jgi:serine/threonine protein kinase